MTHPDSVPLVHESTDPFELELLGAARSEQPPSGAEDRTSERVVGSSEVEADAVEGSVAAPASVPPEPVRRAVPVGETESAAPPTRPSHATESAAPERADGPAPTPARFAPSWRRPALVGLGVGLVTGALVGSWLTWLLLAR